jgi:hypothetical protein
MSRLATLAAVSLLGATLTSCLPLEVGPCSDLEIGEQLAVTIQSPVGNDPCDPALGLVNGATMQLSVEEDGLEGHCISKFGPTAIPGVDLTYQAEASAESSGIGPFVSMSDVDLGPCKGSLLVILDWDEPLEGVPDTFSKMRIRYYPVLDSECPLGCDLDYSVEVTRM